jgi:hypothetical protein
VPKQVSNELRVLQPTFRHRHHLIFCWLLVGQAVYQEKATGTGLARLAPRHIAAWHVRRLLTAGYGNARILLWSLAEQAIAALPHPDDGPYLFGLHIVVRILQWGNYRIPVDFELVCCKEEPRYRSETRLFGWMLVRFRRPSWAEIVVVVAEAAFAFKANGQLIHRRGYFFVMAFART